MNIYTTIKKFILLIVFFVVIFSKAANSIETKWQGINEAQLKLISPLTNTNSQKTIQIGLYYKLKDGWKTYWKSPGRGGFPQEIDYSKSKNINNIEILWPSPKDFSILDLKSLGYQDEVIFPINIELIDTSKPVEINFEVSEASEIEIENILYYSSSSASGIEIFQGCTFNATDESGNLLELSENGTINVSLTFESTRSEFNC